MSFRVREKRVWHSFGAPNPERGSPFGLASQTSFCKLLNSDYKSRSRVFETDGTSAKVFFSK